MSIKFYINEKGKKETKPKEKEPSMRSVFLMNRPEWGYIFIGCIASIIAGGMRYDLTFTILLNY